MRFLIYGADKDTGEDRELILEAFNHIEAEEKAFKQNLYVSKITFLPLQHSAQPQQALSNANVEYPEYHSQTTPASEYRNKIGAVTPDKTEAGTRPCKFCKSPVAKSTRTCPQCGGKKPYPSTTEENTLASVITSIFFLIIASPCLISLLSSNEDVPNIHHEYDPDTDNIGQSLSTLEAQHRQAVSKMLDANTRGDFAEERRWGNEVDRLAEKIRKRKGLE